MTEVDKSSKSIENTYSSDSLSLTGQESFSSQWNTAQIQISQKGLVAAGYINVYDALQLINKELKKELQIPKGSREGCISITLKSGEQLPIFYRRQGGNTYLSILASDKELFNRYTLSILPKKINFLQVEPVQKDEVPITFDDTRKCFALTASEARKRNAMLQTACKEGEKISPDCVRAVLMIHEVPVPFYARIRRLKNSVLCYAISKDTIEQLKKHFGLSTKEKLGQIKSDEVHFSGDGLWGDLKIKGSRYVIRNFFVNYGETIEEAKKNSPDSESITINFQTADATVPLRVFRRWEAERIAYVVKKADVPQLIDLLCKGTTSKSKVSKLNTESEFPITASGLQAAGFSNASKLAVAIRKKLQVFFKEPQQKEAVVSLGAAGSLRLFYRYQYSNTVMAFSKSQLTLFKRVVGQFLNGDNLTYVKRPSLQKGEVPLVARYLRNVFCISLKEANSRVRTLRTMCKNAQSPNSTSSKLMITLPSGESKELAFYKRVLPSGKACFAVKKANIRLLMRYFGDEIVESHVKLFDSEKEDGTGDVIKRLLQSNDDSSLGITTPKRSRAEGKTRTRYDFDEKSDFPFCRRLSLVRTPYEHVVEENGWSFKAYNVSPQFKVFVSSDIIRSNVPSLLGGMSRVCGSEDLRELIIGTYTGNVSFCSKKTVKRGFIVNSHIKEKAAEVWMIKKYQDKLLIIENGSLYVMEQNNPSVLKYDMLQKKEFNVPASVACCATVNGQEYLYTLLSDNSVDVGLFERGLGYKSIEKIQLPFKSHPKSMIAMPTGDILLCFEKGRAAKMKLSSPSALKSVKLLGEVKTGILAVSDFYQQNFAILSADGTLMVYRYNDHAFEKEYAIELGDLFSNTFLERASLSMDFDGVKIYRFTPFQCDLIKVDDNRLESHVLLRQLRRTHVS